MLPVSAIAVNRDNRQLDPIHDIYINPLYAHEVTEADFQKAAVCAAETGTVYHDNPQDAGLELREGMMNRVETVTVNFQTTTYTETYIKSMMREIVAAATAHTGTPNEGDYLKWQYGGWECSVSGYVTNNVYYLGFTYTMPYYTTAAQENEMDAAVAALLADLAPAGTDYQKVKTVYDWICDNVSYDHKNLNDNTYKLKHTAYAALINETAVCQGYALLLYRLALEMDIDCRLIPGDSDGDGKDDHAWNVICLDGLYYNVDATWDASYAASDHYRYFLVTDENFPNHARNADYGTTSFYSTYPMGDVDYDPTVLFGDVNSDGKVNGKDSILLAQYLAEWEVQINLNAADVNGDGRVNGKDSILLAQYLAEWDVTLG